MQDSTHKRSGFTLIELLIAIAIVGVLAATAYPSYREHIRKGNRAAAQSFILEVAQRQQQHFLNSRSYATTLTDLGFPADVLSAFPVSTSVASDIAPFYAMEVTDLGAVNGPPPSFMFRLQPVAGSVQVGDGSLCMSNAGFRTRNCQSGGAMEAW